ncbi:MAG TPA: sigma 54-interacting transcriptional regulator [Methylomirabilota bacterium]|jgi:formate hydrogenlyase transcriptional activator|nr:sigma 54-interacting transcriptional regulator [Methylomirabilota bacterium]
MLVETPPVYPDPLDPAARYRTLLEVNNAIVSNLTRDTLLRAVADALRRVLPFDRSAIFLHDAARDVLTLYMLEASVPSTYFAVGLEMPAGESHVGRVFRQAQPLLRRDITTEGEFPMEASALADGIRSYVIVPLLLRGTPIGTLAVASGTPGQYGTGDITLLEALAVQVALAVENMRVHEELTARAATNARLLAEVEQLTNRLQRENVYLQEEIRKEHNFVEMVGSSPALLATLRRVEQVAPTDSTVLISGETGTGKELIARAIHDRSPRRDRPLVKVNCAAISAGLVESELFGHVKGAFTGALERRHGRFELADGGTLLLDEVGELPLETQVKLLRILQEQEFEPVGSSRTVRVNVRVLAATNRDLEEAVKASRFRADLYYRLAVLPVEVPPLRERHEDIAQLAMFFLARFAKRFGKAVEAISRASLDRLLAYPWPGNVRELQNVIERAVVLADGPVLELGRGLLPASAGRDDPPTPAAGAPDPTESLDGVERRHILVTLERVRWVIEGPQGAARILGLHPNTLRSRMERLGIRRPRPDRS